MHTVHSLDTIENMMLMFWYLSLHQGYGQWPQQSSWGQQNYWGSGSGSGYGSSGYGSGSGWGSSGYGSYGYK